jgi:6-phosphogluconolactonase (cycloisomerase 2 family)
MNIPFHNRVLLVMTALFLCLPTLVCAQDSFLQPLQALVDGQNGVSGLNGVRAMAMSADGKHLYAASEPGASLAFFTRNILSGALAYVERYRDNSSGVDGLDGARSVVITPDGKNVYVTGANDRAIAVFARNASSGRLTFIQMLDLGNFNAPDAIFASVSPDGEELYVSTSNAIAPDGGVAPSAIWQIRIDPADGTLTSQGDIYQDDGAADDLGGEIATALSSDGRHLYATASEDEALVVFTRSQSTGELTHLESIVHSDGKVDGLQRPTSVFLTPDDQYVMVVGRDSPYTVAAYRRDPVAGTLDLVDVQSNGKGGVTGMAGPIFGISSPSGSYVYLVADANDSVTIFSRDENNGDLDFVDSYAEADFFGSIQDALDGPLSLAVSPDGRHLYVAGYVGNTLGVFRTADGGSLPAEGFHINAGLNGSWYDPATDGQGFLIDVFPDSGVMFLAWFTYDTDAPDASVTANLGHPSQRWLTAQGPYADTEAVLDIFVSGGGIFDMYPPAPTREKDGTLTIEFEDCNNGTITYDLPSIGRQGIIPIQRIVTENVPLCQSLSVTTEAGQ